MKTTRMTSVQEAAEKLLDALVEGKSVLLNLSFERSAGDVLEPLLGAIHEAARERGVGVTIDEKGEGELCLSLLRP